MSVAMWLLDTVNAPVASDSMRGASLYTAKKLFDHLLLFELPIPNSSLFRGLFFFLSGQGLHSNAATKEPF